MKKILGFSLLLLSLALMAGCGNDAKDVSISISQGPGIIQAGDTVFLQVTAKNTGIIMPDPKDVPGSFRLIGSTGIQYTAPDDPNDIPATDGVVAITVTAAADKSKTDTAKLKVQHKAPTGSIQPEKPVLLWFAPNQQFIATFRNGLKAPLYDAIPRYRFIPEKQWDDAKGKLETPNLGHFLDCPDEKETPDLIETCYSDSGVFIHSVIERGFGTVEATIDLPDSYGKDANGSPRKAVVTARVTVRPPSDRFQWIALMPNVGYGTGNATAPTLSRPFFTNDKLTVNADGDYVVYHSCQTNTTTCAQRFIKKETGVVEGSPITAGLIKNPNPPLPIPLRSGTPTYAPHTDAAKEYLPAAVLMDDVIPSTPDSAGFGAAHPGLASMYEGDEFTIGVFELSLNIFPPFARIMMARWPNDIGPTEKEKVEVIDVLSRYDIVPFSYQPPMSAKIVRSSPPKEPKNPLDPLDADSVAEWDKYREALANYSETWALGYYNGTRMAVRRIEGLEPGQRMRLADRTIGWEPLQGSVQRATSRNYFQDVVYKNYDDFVALGVSAGANAADAYGMTSWRYLTGLAMVRKTISDIEHENEMKAYYGDPEAEEDEVEKREGSYETWKKANAEWELEFGAAYREWLADTSTTKPAWTDWPPDQPDAPNPDKGHVRTVYEQLGNAVFGLTRYQILYGIRDPEDNRLIVAGYGIETDTGAMIGFMAKSFEEDLSKR